MLKRSSLRVAGFFSLVALSLACNLPGRIAKPSPEPIPVSTQAVENLEQELQAAAGALRAGEAVTVVIDEAELTSLVTFKLQESGFSGFQEPQIYLRDGLITITGKVTQDGSQLPLEIKVSLSVKPPGKLVARVDGAKMGFVPIPRSVLEQYAGDLDEAVNEILSPGTEGVIVQQVVIGDGKMVIQGVASAP